MFPFSVFYYALFFIVILLQKTKKKKMKKISINTIFKKFKTVSS